MPNMLTMEMRTKRLYRIVSKSHHFVRLSTYKRSNVHAVLTPLQTSSKAFRAALVLAPQRLLICDLTLEASGPHTVGRSAGASSVLETRQF